MTPEELTRKLQGHKFPPDCDFCCQPSPDGTLFIHSAFQVCRGDRLIDAEQGGFYGCPACGELFKACEFQKLAERVALALGAIGEETLFRDVYTAVGFALLFENPKPLEALKE